MHIPLSYCSSKTNHHQYPSLTEQFLNSNLLHDNISGSRSDLSVHGSGLGMIEVVTTSDRLHQLVSGNLRILEERGDALLTALLQDIFLSIPVWRSLALVTLDNLLAHEKSGRYYRETLSVNSSITHVELNLYIYVYAPHPHLCLYLGG